MKKENYNIETLGEYYLSPIQLKDKTLIIETINRFINQENNFKPLFRISGNHQNSAIINDQYKNQYQVLDYNYFMTNYNDYNTYSSGNEIAIVYNLITKNKQILIRRNWHSVTEISNRLGISTLVGLYHAFITNIVSYSSLIRERKEKISNFIGMITSSQKYIEYSKFAKEFTIITFSDVEIKDSSKPMITFNTTRKRIRISDLSCGKPITCYDTKNYHSVRKLEDIDKSFYNTIHPITDINAMLDSIRKSYDEEIQNCLKNIEESEKALESLINNLN